MSEAYGRQAELAAAGAFLDSVTQSSTSLVIEGEAGIGKTTIWRQALAAAHERSYRALACQPAESETKFAFAALTDLLESVVDEVGAVLPPPQSRALAVALLRADNPGMPGDQRAVCLAALGIVNALAAGGPVILAVDDVQWLDVPSERVVRYVIRRLRSERVGILVASRADDGSTPLGLDRAMPEGRLTRVALGPLDPESIHRLIADRLGPLLPRRTTRQIHRACGGNPFFAVEIARAMLREGTRLLPALQLPLPVAIRAVTAQRLKGLTPIGREALTVAAALSSPTVPLVTAVMRRGALAGLRSAAAEGLVELDREQIRFVHPMLRSLIYSEMPMDGRRRLHRRLSLAVADLEERAWHLALGASHADAEVARTLDDAARRAAMRGAPEAAAALSRQGRLLTPNQRPMDTWRRMVDEAVYRYEAGDVGAAGELLEQVAAAAPAGTVRADALRHLGTAHRFHDSLPDAAALLRQALVEAGNDEPLRARIERALAWIVTLGGDVPTGFRHAELALALAERADPKGLPETLGMFVMCQFFLTGRVDEDRLRRALDLEDWGTYTPNVWRPSYMQAFVLKSIDQLDAARSQMEQLYRRTLEQGDESSLPFLLFQWSELECWAGNWDRAARYAQEGHERAVQTGLELQKSAMLYARALVDAHLGRVDAARSAAQEGLRQGERAGLVPMIQHNTTVLAFIDLSLGDPAAVDQRLGVFGDLLAAAGLGEPGMYRFLPDEVEALVELGELERAERLVRPFEERATATQRRWALAVGARCRGLLCAASGDLAGALRTLDESLECHRDLPMPFELGRTLLVTGTVQRRAKHQRAARESLSQALGIFDRLGAPLWATKARSKLDRIGGRAPGARELTPSEDRVARLVADGLTNREVADTLFVSVATVEATLWKVYRKLGVRSRTELALRLTGKPGSGAR